MRRTKATLIYWRTGNLRAVEFLLGYGATIRMESTVRNLEIKVEDPLALAKQTEI